MKKLLIEAISTNSGGAIAHLKNLLKNFDEQKYFNRVDVYLPLTTKKLMPINKKINYISPKLSKNLFLRIFWQIIFLNFITLKKKYDCIFVTGSSHLLIARPVVTISQNLLPFSKNEINKYFFSIFYIKLKILNLVQSISFKMLPATRLAKLLPDKVRTGHSAQIASLVEVCALYGYVSKNKSII